MVLHSLGLGSLPPSPRIKVRVRASYLTVAIFVENNNQSFTAERIFTSEESLLSNKVKNNNKQA